MCVGLRGWVFQWPELDFFNAVASSRWLDVSVDDVLWAVVYVFESLVKQDEHDFRTQDDSSIIKATSKGRQLAFLYDANGDATRLYLRSQHDQDGTKAPDKLTQTRFSSLN
ncbi:hypothetical protein SASPL_109427 [Salvia splendens]|uniref:Uncharacterized protein n=1 Tax=Salvia splendens TaxID=180675 RepID=A0A8X8YEU3_SALSN|nr:hypothetical protein SASPL_109427 [Salvia splendens]